MSLSVQSGDVIDFDLFLVAAAYGSDAGGSGSANYFDTAGVSSLMLINGNGSPVIGADIITASGTQYPNGSIATPEPPSLLLLGLGLLMIGIVQTRRISSPTPSAT
jgi:hypothetical protein